MRDNSDHCRGCGAQIVWLKTAAGRSMPVDAVSVEVGDREFDYARHMSHFATCPEAAAFRARKKTK